MKKDYGKKDYGNIAEEDTGSGAMVEGFVLSGDQVKDMADKTFSILSTPIYKDIPDKDHPGETKRKMILSVKLGEGSIVEYWPNKTSQKTIMNKCGFKLDGWAGYRGEFVVLPQMVGSDMKNVIYIKEEKK